MVTTWRNHLTLPIVSFQDSAIAGRLDAWVVDPSKLQLCAWLCQIPGMRSRQLLLPTDVLHLDQRHIIINSQSDLVDTQDVWRLQNLVKLRYTPIGKGVYTESGKRLGFVTDFNFDTESWYIHKLQIKPGLFSSIRTDSPYIDRRQILEVTAHRIIVQDTKSLSSHLLAQSFGPGANQSPS
jgi:uncharacterized protein YrrD